MSAVYELYHRAVVDGDLYAQYDLAALEEEERQAEAEEASWTEEYARREENRFWRYYHVVCMRRHLPMFTYRQRLGRERRPACNARCRGSRRTRTGSSSDDDPPGESDQLDNQGGAVIGAVQLRLLAGKYRKAR